MASLSSLPARARRPASLPSSFTETRAPAPPFSGPSSRVRICRKRHLSVLCLLRSQTDHEALGSFQRWLRVKGLKFLPKQTDSPIYRLEEELAELEAEPAKTTMEHFLDKEVSMASISDLICTSRTTHRKSSPPKSSVIKSWWEGCITRRAIMSTMLIMETCLAGRQALAEEWGTHSLILERFFLPDLSPENSAARIRQTAQGMHGLRHMLDTMSWRYVIFYIRQKASYLSSDLKNALATLPENRRQTYVRTANELVENMSELDYYVRTPKVYESYLFYEKTLKSLDDLVAILA